MSVFRKQAPFINLATAGVFQRLTGICQGAYRSGRRVQWTIEDRVPDGHRFAQTVAYVDLGRENPAPITAAYEQQAEPVIELRLEKAGVRLAHLLNNALQGK